MIGSLVGAGLSAVGSIFGGIEYNAVLVGEINLARRAVSLGLWLRLKVCEAMSAKIPFERAFLVGRTLLSPTGFLS